MPNSEEVVFPKFDMSEYDDDDIEEFQKMINELRDIKHKAIKTAIKDKYTQYYKKLIDEEMYEQFPGYCGEELQRLHKVKQKADNITDVKQGNNTHCFFTINFKEDQQNMENIHEVMEDFTKKSSFVKDDYAYAIEQRSEEMEHAGKGSHVHILFKKGSNAPSKIQRAFKTKFFDKYVGTPAALDYRYIKDDKVEEKLKYICGIKQKEKMPKVIVDRIHRKNLKIPDVITNGYDVELEGIKFKNSLPITLKAYDIY